MSLKEIVYYLAIFIVVGIINAAFIYWINQTVDSGLLISILTYFSLFISIIVLYSTVFGFELKTFFHFVLAFIGSLMIAAFLVIFMAPSYCNNTSEQNLAFYFQSIFYALLVYLLYFYINYYVVPFMTANPPYNKWQHDLIFGGIIGGLFLIQTWFNYLKENASFKQLDYYTFIVWITALLLKLGVVMRQYFVLKTPPHHFDDDIEMQQMLGSGPYWYDQRYGNSRHTGKSAFYNFT